MKAFFDKYEVKLNEGDAIKVMQDQIYVAKKAYENDPDSKGYCSELVKLHEMIEDLFEAKGLDMDEY